MITETYLQKAWGDTIDNVTIDDIKVAISETIEMDDEHSAFWVAIIEDEESILETHKDLIVIGSFPTKQEEEIKAKFNSWNEIEVLYHQFLATEYDSVIKTLLANQTNSI